MESVERRATRVVRIGTIAVGGSHPIAVQSMTNTDTADLAATLDQARRLAAAGCEVVRMAVRDAAAAAALPALRRELAGVPLVADIHFQADLAVAALEAGFDKVRINPGNLRGAGGLERIVAAARDRGAAIRVGVNSGSVERALRERHGGPTPEALVESALGQVGRLEALGFGAIVISIKSTDTLATLRACRLLAQRTDHPQHLGITEAGPPGYGELKSAAGLGALLLDGIGDTLRISLSGDPLPEVRAAFDLLKATGRRIRDPEIIACPTCGRIQVDLAPLVREIQAFAATLRAPIRIAVMGCAVNGPGEAREADVALAGGKGEGLIYRRGRIVRKVPAAEMLAALRREILELIAEERLEGTER